MSNNATLAREAVIAAARLRSEHGIGLSTGLCPYDLAIKLEIKVSFLAASSLEGMYSPEPHPPSIILSSERPAGRRRYTCAHELGHHVFKHGTKIDELEDGASSPLSPEEFLAQRFASALLMPKLAVDSAFSRRGWKFSSATPEQVYIVAQELGVGYGTLITNAEINLNSLSKAQANSLSSIPLPKIRAGILGSEAKSDVFLVDQHWLRPTVDAEVGDFIVLPKNWEIQGTCAVRSSSTVFTAAMPGSAPLFIDGHATPITLRVSKKNYVGLARYRHLEETDDDE